MHVLIVDDEPIIRIGLEQMAKAYSPSFTEIRTAENGGDALEKIRLSVPDILLTDIRMPKIDGIELCRVVHEQYSQIQTIVVSGYSDFEYAQKCLSYGVKQYLLKPVTPPELYEAFDAFCERPLTHFVPVSRYLEWIDHMEQCLLSMQMIEIDALMEQWRLYCAKAHYSGSQMKEMLTECITMLLKRFQARHLVLNVEVPDFEASNMKLAMDAFELCLRAIAQDLQSGRKGSYKDPMEEAKSYVDSRLSQDISLEEVAKRVGLSPTYFCVLFKKMTNETFVQYRIHKRMEKAKELLAYSHHRISDIAAEVGYEDYSHFTKTFKKMIGVSPSEYRIELGIK